jgi:hypothetical protein
MINSMQLRPEDDHTTHENSDNYPTSIEEYPTSDTGNDSGDESEA